MSEYSRSSATFKNYAISLGVIIAIVLALAFVVSTRSGENIPSVDYRPEAEVLRGSADYPVTMPADDLAEQGWTPTSSTLETAGPVEWSVGFATAADSHVMFTQSDGDPDAVVADRSRGAEETGTVAVGGREWEHYESEDWSALVLREDGYTLVVAGPADLDELAHFAGGLETDAEGGDGAGAAEEPAGDS
ncbi:DUF4245 domain-containing protein [Nocardiopsis changdeensis]|uniref:DUF4245 domain-containing protein n=1 Tax=Nocardiopsis changdeensis TaxID=2831969 RepID=A0ABX8BLQ7_9ACTN|nr:MULTISPECIES: DUF4245 domain-containing protein [Nocardiopsis]QUX21997.1 DUF4245 domain-containing protein [Nocardiopsis changdeensis]QYX37934.1 DUF4245 domain-containing protein [Nocardiopsis sp. MT53]